MQVKDRGALLSFMEYKGIKSAYELARRANLGVGIVGHIVSGRRTTCSPKTARAIEGALEAPQGFLFVARMSQVTEDVRPRGKVAA